MSNAVLKGHASGTGTVTLETPNTNSDRTISLPDATGTVMVSGNMPAFSVYRSGGQTGVSLSTFTKVQLNTETFDTANAFDSTTNYRFQPTVAGYYQITAAVANGSATTNLTRAIASIFKNGVEVQRGNDFTLTFGSAGTQASCMAGGLFYLNGSTDYIELYGYLIAGSGTGQFFGTDTWMNGVLVRAA